MAASTSNKELTTIRAWLGRAHKLRIILDNPAKHTPRLWEKRVTPPRCVTRREFDAFLAHARPKLRLVALVLWHTACRAPEALSLRREQVDLDAGTINIYRHKTDKWVALPLAPELRRALAGERDQGHATATGEPIDDDGGKARITLWSYGRMKKAWNACCEAAGVRFGCHHLRSTFASRSQAAGVSLAVVQAILGHSSPTTTAHYYTNPEQAIIVAFNALNE